MIFFDIDGTLLDYEVAERNGIIDFSNIYLLLVNLVYRNRILKFFTEPYYNRTEMKDCYYIGDRLETDAISSTAAGMQGIWLNRDNSQLKYDIPTICSLHEIITMI